MREPRRPGRIGYTAGVFDMFHLGHLTLLREARRRCDFLIVGITTDELAHEAKSVLPVVPLVERMAVVQSMRFVDQVVPQLTTDKLQAWNTFRFDVLFAGDNLRGRPEWEETEAVLGRQSVAVEYLPSTYRAGGGLLDRGVADLALEVVER